MESSCDRVVRLWREHRRWVAAVIYAHMPRGADLDDLLQEVVVTLLRHIDRLHETDAIGPWLRTVAINIARDAGRRHKVRRTALESPAVQARLDRSRHEDVDRAESMDRGRAALGIAQELPPDYREPMLLNLRGLSYKQIARLLELPVSTIETRLFRARNMVREELQQRDRRVQDDVNRAELQAATIPFKPMPISSPGPDAGKRVNHE